MGSGGKREGAGRPPKLSKQLVMAEKLAKQLQVFLSSGLQTLAENFPALVEGSIEEALNSEDPKIRSQERRFLISKFIELVRMEDGSDTELGKMAKIWIDKANIDVHMAGESTGYNSESDGPGRGETVQVVEGTGRSLPD